MGYKSVLRSTSSSIKKTSREYERVQRAKQRDKERLQKKIEKLEEKRGKVIGSLQDLYAKGKISKGDYSKLLQREKDIKYPLLCFGKAAGVSLAKRYICGKITPDEFNEMQRDLIPEGVFDEQNTIVQELERQRVSLNDFKQELFEGNKINCQKCKKKKSLFSPLKEYNGFELCGSCKKRYVDLQTYKGFIGDYFEVESFPVDSEIVNVNLRSEYF